MAFSNRKNGLSYRPVITTYGITGWPSQTNSGQNWVIQTNPGSQIVKIRQIAWFQYNVLCMTEWLTHFLKVALLFIYGTLLLLYYSLRSNKSDWFLLRMVLQDGWNVNWYVKKIDHFVFPRACEISHFYWIGGSIYFYNFSKIKSDKFWLLKFHPRLIGEVVITGTRVYIFKTNHQTKE